MTLDEWIVYGETGSSSKTMWAALKGIDIPNNFGSIPYDPADFSRCYNLVKKCKINTAHLKIIAEKLPYWRPYIDNWDKLCEMYEANEAKNWTTRHEEVGMYAYMWQLRKESCALRYF